jgi:GTP pyrophosphokinase
LKFANDYVKILFNLTEGGNFMSKSTFFLEEDFNKEDSIIYGNSYMFLKAIAIDNHFDQMGISLAVARRLHEGQHRLDGTPYFLHPLKVCSTLYNYGIKDDVILAGAILHDVLEDCQDKLPLGGKELVVDYGISVEVFELIELLTKKHGLNDDELSVYFDKIRKNPKALLIKLADRLHNSQTLYTYSHDKLKKYLKETSTYIIPMARWGKNFYPQYTNALSILKSNIYSLNHSMEIITDIYDKQLEQKDKEIEELKKQISNNLKN